MAVPEELYDKFFATPLIQEIIQSNSIYLITYNIEQEIISQWIPLPNTANTSSKS
ncbi:MAG: element excision factor XisH family protein [Cyanobacteriota bacterium]